MKKYIAVAGNIGVGKTTLVEMLCQRLKFLPFLEPYSENPYLKDFYDSMETWSFHSQIYFLTQRIRLHQQLERSTVSIVQDRSIYEDAEIFARNLYIQKKMTERDYNTYYNLYETITRFLTPPDLVIYLRSEVPVLESRIRSRSRSFEQEIPNAYLCQLNDLYEDWISRFNFCPVLTIPADALDFVKYPQHLDLIVSKVKEKLTGKDEVIFYPEEVNRI
jgi:deoxyadenosine/deoxycytidine kinase